MPKKNAEPRTHHVYAAGKGTHVSIGGFGVATHDEPCSVPAGVARELERNSKVRVERIAEAVPKPTPATPTPATPAKKKGDA